MKPTSCYRKKGLRILMILSISCLSGTALALNSDSVSSPLSNSSVLVNSLDQSSRNRDESSFQSVLQPLRHAQSNRNNASLRSKSEVMQEVKSRYNGQVVKISLNERTAMYSVRVLLPSGKVKSLSISARK